MRKLVWGITAGAHADCAAKSSATSAVQAQLAPILPTAKHSTWPAPERAGFAGFGALCAFLAAAKPQTQSGDPNMMERWISWLCSTVCSCMIFLISPCHLWCPERFLDLQVDLLHADLQPLQLLRTQLVHLEIASYNETLHWCTGVLRSLS